MMRALFAVASTALVASIGVALGLAVQGSTPWALVQVASGAAGGFGIGWAGLHVVDRRRALRPRADT